MTDAPLPPALDPACPVLLLYSRQGCCLCEGLEERLLALPQLPPLQRLDVDADPQLRQRYDLRVPVLAWRGRDLPPVPPRLQAERLWRWLEQQGVGA